MGPAAGPAPPRTPRPARPLCPPPPTRLSSGLWGSLSPLGIFQAAEVRAAGAPSPAPPLPSGS